MIRPSSLYNQTNSNIIAVVPSHTDIEDLVIVLLSIHNNQLFTDTTMCPRGLMVKAMNCGIVVREFVLQSRYYVHFRANTLGKGMNPLILPPAMDK